VALGDTPVPTPGTYSIGDETLTMELPAGTAVGYAVYMTKPQSSSRLSRQFSYSFNRSMVAGESDPTISAASGTLAGIAAGQVFYMRLVAYGSASPKLGRVGTAQEFRVAAVA
jgi:hypothetical protein